MPQLRLGNGAFSQADTFVGQSDTNNQYARSTNESSNRTQINSSENLGHFNLPLDEFDNFYCRFRKVGGKPQRYDHSEAPPEAFSNRGSIQRSRREVVIRFDQNVRAIFGCAPYDLTKFVKANAFHLLDDAPADIPVDVARVWLDH